MVSKVAARPAVDEVWRWLATVPDPEIPVISVVELGIVRDVAWQGDRLVVTITPTYSGCPATEAIQQAIEQVLLAHGLATAEVRTRLAPAWTTDWLDADAREKLRAHGIAAPGPVPRQARVLDIRALVEEPAPACPRCGCARTRLVSRFGSTPCKSAHVCEACLEAFERFKCH
jgi:ring-1,2-phenylacetyl-CoA epoxidase subunit PaaD